MKHVVNDVPVVASLPDVVGSNCSVTLLRLTAVKAISGLSRASIYARMKDGTFPKAVKLGTGARCVGWVSTEVNQWVYQQMASRHSASDQRAFGANLLRVRIPLSAATISARAVKKGGR